MKPSILAGVFAILLIVETYAQTDACTGLDLKALCPDQCNPNRPELITFQPRDVNGVCECGLPGGISAAPQDCFTRQCDVDPVTNTGELFYVTECPDQCGDGEIISFGTAEVVNGVCECSNPSTITVPPSDACQTVECVVDETTGEPDLIEVRVCPDVCNGSSIGTFNPTIVNGQCVCGEITVPQTNACTLTECQLDASGTATLTEEPKCASDGDVCTTDCDLAAGGVCNYTPIALACDDLDPCTRDRLATIDNQCQCVHSDPVVCSDQAVCDDGSCIALVDNNGVLVQADDFSAANEGVTYVKVNATVGVFATPVDTSNDIVLDYAGSLNENDLKIPEGEIVKITFDVENEPDSSNFEPTGVVVDVAGTPLVIAYADALGGNICPVSVDESGQTSADSAIVCILQSTPDPGEFDAIPATTFTGESACQLPPCDSAYCTYVDLCINGVRDDDCNCISNNKKRSENPDLITIESTGIRFTNGLFPRLITNLRYSTVKAEPKREGCPKGFGYWKRNFVENPDLELCGLSVEEQLAMKPKGGNAWVIENRERVTAILNRDILLTPLNAEVQALLVESTAVLAETCTSIKPRGSNRAERRESISRASLLHQYNENKLIPNDNCIDVESEDGRNNNNDDDDDDDKKNNGNGKAKGKTHSWNSDQLEEDAYVDALNASKDYEPSLTDALYANDKRSDTPGPQFSPLGVVLLVVVTLMIVAAVGIVGYAVKRHRDQHSYQIAGDEPDAMEMQQNDEYCDEISSQSDDSQYTKVDL